MRSPQEVLIKPVISERSMGLMEDNKYTFYVDRNANKIEIRHAVEKLFKVNVLNVNTITVRGKKRRQGKYEGRTSDRKKAIVTLKPGDKIEIFEGL
ncbi:50S ribosomal protein L23 [Bacillota bacterium LX-D]|nr:50S ribosomal protein L23 [Bacillota bacterium LX-D]